MLKVNDSIKGITSYSPAAVNGRLPRVLLVAPFDLNDNGIGLNMGTHRIAHFLADKGHARVDVVDSVIGFDRTLGRFGQSKRYDIVGVSTLTAIHFKMAVAKIDMIRRYLGNVLLITGGHGMKMDHDKLFSFKVDIAVMGLGEFPMAEICDRFAKAGSLLERFGDVSGISINNKGRAHKTTPRILTQKDYETVNDSLDFTKLPIRPKGRTVEFEMSFSTHCPNVCVFCSASNFDKRENRRVIYYPEDKILEKLNRFVDHHMKTNSPERFRVMFSDDNLTVNKARFFRILEGIDEIRKRTKCEISFECLSRFECLTDDLLERAAKLGVTAMAVGVESRIPEILKFLKPGADPTKLEGLERRMLKYGINPIEFFMVAPPIATTATILRTAEDMLQAIRNGATVKPFLRMEAYQGSPAMTMGFKTKAFEFNSNNTWSLTAPFSLPLYFKNRDRHVEKILDEIDRTWGKVIKAFCKVREMDPGKFNAVMDDVVGAMLVLSIFHVLEIKDKRMQDAEETLNILGNDPLYFVRKAYDRILPKA